MPLFKQTNINNLLPPTKFDLRKYLDSFVAFSISLSVLYNLFEYTDLSNSLPTNFDNFLLYFAGKVTTGTRSFCVFDSKNNIIRTVSTIFNTRQSKSIMPCLSKIECNLDTLIVQQLLHFFKKIKLFPPTTVV